MIRFGEGPTAADRHETRVAVFREDHTQHPSTRNCQRLTRCSPLHSHFLMGEVVGRPKSPCGQNAPSEAFWVEGQSSCCFCYGRWVQMILSGGLWCSRKTAPSAWHAPRPHNAEPAGRLGSDRWWRRIPTREFVRLQALGHESVGVGTQAHLSPRTGRQQIWASQTQKVADLLTLRPVEVDQ